MNTQPLPPTESNAVLDAALAVPGDDVIDLFRRLDGDIIILGIAGKIGMSLGSMAAQARDAAGGAQKIYGAGRSFSADVRKQIEVAGIIPVEADLFDRESVAKLPQVENVFYLAGRKFGTTGSEALTWASNVIMPAYACHHYKDSRIIAFSTGCVYPLVTQDTGGCSEDVPPAPVGEYAQSCLGRERIFEYYADANGTRVCLFRLNYAVDLRYGVLYDIADRIWKGEPVPLSAPCFNILWQGDVNRYALLSLELADSPASILNVTGPEMLSTRDTALLLGEKMNKTVTFEGTEGDICYLNNATFCFDRFGPPCITAETLIDWQADWIVKGGVGLGKPTHFEVNDGKF